MTAQEVFDTAVNGIREQGGRSVNSAGNCMYRSEDGRKCAAGQLMPDSAYDKTMEDVTITLLLNQPDKYPGLAFLDEHKLLIASVQRAHDYGGGPGCTPVYGLSGHTPEKQEEIVEKAFQAVAEEYGLKYERKPWAKVPA